MDTLMKANVALLPSRETKPGSHLMSVYLIFLEKLLFLFLLKCTIVNKQEYFSLDYFMHQNLFALKLYHHFFLFVRC
jgi:hypothetical protein